MDLGTGAIRETLQQRGFPTNDLDVVDDLAQITAYYQANSQPQAAAIAYRSGDIAVYRKPRNQSAPPRGDAIQLINRIAQGDHIESSPQTAELYRLLQAHYGVSSLTAVMRHAYITNVRGLLPPIRPAQTPWHARIIFALPRDYKPQLRAGELRALERCLRGEPQNNTTKTMTSRTRRRLGCHSTSLAILIAILLGYFKPGPFRPAEVEAGYLIKTRALRDMGFNREDVASHFNVTVDAIKSRNRLTSPTKTGVSRPMKILEAFQTGLYIPARY
jgi:hypothetical protein